MSKLCPHIQILSNDTLEAIRRIQPPMVKIMDPSRDDVLAIRAAAPSTLVVARRYTPNQGYDMPEAQAAVFASMYEGIINEIHVAEVYNEAVNNTTQPEQVTQFDEFQVAFAQRIWQMRPECKVGLFCLPTGNFGYPGEWKLHDFPKSLALPKDRVYICLHEYAWYTWDWESPARCLRYRRIMEGLTGYDVLITECGLTQMVLANHPDTGWRSGVERDVFIDGAAWYDAELQKDAYVRGAALFNCGPSYGWDTFECTVEWKEAANRTPVVIEPWFETPIRVLVGTKVVTMELESYLESVVPAEVYASWDMEALRAQSVAARTFAMWRIAHPRSSDFDLYADARDQVYDPSMVHERTTQAVKDTKEVYISGDFKALYVSKCGRMDCRYCLGANGYNNNTWAARMCQFGAQTMAEQGYDWRTILAHYYGSGTLFSDGIVLPEGVGQMKLSDYPVPVGNTKWGMHAYPFQCNDIPGQSYEWHRRYIQDMKDMGANWISIISSPGGSDGYTKGKPGCSEMTFEIACELGLMPIVRIFNAPTPPYFTEAVETLCTRLLTISKGKPFYLKLNNEIDAEWKASTGREMTLEDAANCCRGIGQAIDAVWAKFGGKVIPSFLNVGYGGTGYNFFQIMHDVGMGDRLDRCWVPVHPYNGAWEIDWPWSPTLLTPKLLTQEEYDSYGDWAWGIGTAAVQTLEFVNQKRMEAHEQRIKLGTMDELIGAYAYGFFTYQWALWMLNSLGHNETPLLFPEWGTRVGETVPGLPAVGPRRHMELTLQMIEEMQQEPRILGGGMWMYDAHGTSQNWFDQALYSPVWDIKYHENMPQDWKNEIVTWGQLPLVDYLLEHPVGTIPTPEIPEEEIPVPEPNVVNDAVNYGVKIEPVSVPIGTKYYKIVKVHHYTSAENGSWPGMHHLFMDVLDESGKRMNGTKITLTNTGNGTVFYTVVDKPPDEPGTNVPMEKGDTLSAWVGTGLSEVVSGVHTRHPDEGVGSSNNLGHHSFIVTWKLVTKAGDVVPPTPPEPPVSGTPTDEEIRNELWKKVYPNGIAYNPDATFPKFAREKGLGAPVTNEVDVGGLRVQGFAGRIVYATVGDWANVKMLSW